MAWTGGKPGAESEFRCEALTHKGQCEFWAMKGQRFCHHHSPKNNFGYAPRRSTGYQNALGPKLSKRLTEILDAPIVEQQSLYEELAVMRLLTEQALALASPVLAGEVDYKNEAQRATMVALAISTVREALNNVRDMATALSRIEAQRDDKLSIQAMGLFLNQVTRAIADIIGDDDATLHKICAALDKRVRLPLLNSPNGSDILISAPANEATDIAEAMDAITIPSSTTTSMEEQGEISINPSGPTFGKNGTSKTQACDIPTNPETLE